MCGRPFALNRSGRRPTILHTLVAPMAGSQRRFGDFGATEPGGYRLGRAAGRSVARRTSPSTRFRQPSRVDASPAT
jgi:hypothetical protein